MRVCFYKNHSKVRHTMNISNENQTPAKKIGDYSDLLDVTETSQLLGVSKKTVYNLLKAEQIKKKKVGRAYRIPKVYIKEFLGIN